MTAEQHEQTAAGPDTMLDRKEADRVLAVLMAGLPRRRVETLVRLGAVPPPVVGTDGVPRWRLADLGRVLAER